jgi:hypothetical protein
MLLPIQAPPVVRHPVPAARLPEFCLRTGVGISQPAPPAYAPDEVNFFCKPFNKVHGQATTGGPEKVLTIKFGNLDEEYTDYHCA